MILRRVKANKDAIKQIKMCAWKDESILCFVHVFTKNVLETVLSMEILKRRPNLVCVLKKFITHGRRNPDNNQNTGYKTVSHWHGENTRKQDGVKSVNWEK